MKVFISWSGQQSKAVGKVLHTYLPRIVQSLRPWMSDTDIESGQRWQQEVGTQLEGCDVGICILTKDNFDRPWLNFEAGAISKAAHRGRPIGLFFDVRDSEVNGPILQFQCRQATREGVLSLVQDLNGLLAEHCLDEGHLLDTFDRYWPSIEENFAAIQDAQGSDKSSVPRMDRDLLEEILGLVRALHQPPPVLPGGAGAIAAVSADGDTLQVSESLAAKRDASPNAHNLPTGNVTKE